MQLAEAQSSLHQSRRENEQLTTRVTHLTEGIYHEGIFYERIWIFLSVMYCFHSRMVNLIQF